MYFRPAMVALSIALILMSGAGCQKTETPAAATVLSPDTIASVHWLGKRRLGYEAAAFYFMRVWNLSQSARLEKQTIERLTTVPERFFPGGSNLAANSDMAGAAMLPLTYDLEQEETYLEIRAATNLPPDMVLALRLTDNGQAGRWFTNLAAVLQPMTGARAVLDPVNQGWSLKTTNALNLIQLARVGDWTLVGLASDKNPLLAEIAARIRRDGVPFVSSGTNLWLEASLDLPRLAAAFPAFNFQLSTFNHFDLTVTGDGGNVITRGQLTFTQPLSAPLPPWQLPVNLMHEPLASFIAVRGLQSWLAGSQFWRDLQIAAPPGQLFFWSLTGSPYQTYFAAPLPDASRQVAALADHLLQKGNPWLAANGYIGFDRAPDANGVIWGNLPEIKPFIKSAGTGADGWLYAGLFPDTNAAAAPPPAGLLQDILRRPNLVYYDWEVTGPRLQPDLQLAQTARQIARRPAMSLDSASLDWLAMLIPRLGTSATIISRPAPGQLTFVRRSTLGLTAPELHLLADWLESPQFPRGLHSAP